MAKRDMPSKEKAKKILKDGKVHGKILTPAQKRLFGMLAGGVKPTKLKKRK